MSKSRKYKNFISLYIEYLTFMVLRYFVRALSMKNAVRLSHAIAKFIFFADRKHRNRTISHLLHAGVAENRHQAIDLAGKVYRNFTTLAVEIIKFDQMFDPAKVKQIVGVRASEGDYDHIVKTGKNNENLILVTAHYGNWELAATSYSLQSGRLIDSVMRPFNNPLIGKVILDARQNDLHATFGKQGAIKHMLKALKSGHTVAILADQHAGAQEGIITSFFGQPARTHFSPALLHLKTGVPIAPVVTHRCDEDFHFEHRFAPLIRYTPTGDKDEDIRKVTQMYTDALEKLISECPEQWLWTHRRWLNINRKHRYDDCVNEFVAGKGDHEEGAA